MLPLWLSGKESACNGGDPGLIPGSGKSPGEGNGNPLHSSCLDNPMDGGAWWATQSVGLQNLDATEQLTLSYLICAQIISFNYLQICRYRKKMVYVQIVHDFSNFRFIIVPKKLVVFQLPCIHVSESCWVVSDSLQPHGLYSPWNSPGQNTGVGSLSLLQGFFPA